MDVNSDAESSGHVTMSLWGRNSKLFPVTSSLDAMLELQETAHLLEFPRLEPLKVAVAKYDSTHDVVILKLQNAEGSEYLTASVMDMNGRKTFLEGVASSYPGFLLVARPQLTAKELEAVHAGHFFRGMSRDALEYAIGLADKENDWGRGGRQLVYFDGRIMVYVGAGDRVEDWQSLDE